MGQDVTIFAIDHSVGAGGVNRMDDVQLIQILINRYVVYEAAAYKEYGSDTRAVDKSGGQIKQLKVDGLDGRVLRPWSLHHAVPIVLVESRPRIGTPTQRPSWGRIKTLYR
jgi:hypothetical protein